MVLITPSAVMQTRRYRFARRHVYLEVAVKGVSTPVDVVLRIMSEDGKALAKASPHTTCDVAPTTVGAGLLDAINKHAGSASRSALLNDDGKLTALLTEPDPDAKSDDPDPARVDKADDEVDWDAVRDRLVECLPGYAKYLTIQAQTLRAQLDDVSRQLEARREELEEQAQQIEERLAAVERSSPKASAVPAPPKKPISVPSGDQTTIPPSIPPTHTRHGQVR